MNLHLWLGRCGAHSLLASVVIQLDAPGKQLDD
jgi:hypothetical protein